MLAAREFEQHYQRQASKQALRRFHASTSNSRNPAEAEISDVS